jgi:hypothetical protein
MERNTALPDAPARFARGAVALLLGLFPAVCGLAALALGQDANWDLRNYHYYNPFAFLNGRMGFDIAVAHVATYYNPLIYFPFYFAVNAFEPRVIGFALGFLPGLNLLLLYAAARRALAPAELAGRRWFCLALALVGFLGSANLAEIGTSYFDNLLSLPVLIAFWLLLRCRDGLGGSGARPWAAAAGAGLLAGAAFGMKLPFAIYAVGLCAAFFALELPFRRRFLLAFTFGLGVLAGTALTGGFWMLEMWRRFANPLFPYFNEIFKSEWGALGSYRDDRFIPKSVGVALIFPFWFTADPMRVGEIAFRDLRFPLLYALAIPAAAAALGRRLGGRRGGREAPPARSPAAPFVFVFMAVTFAVWMAVFAIYRYIIVAEFLAPLAICLVLGRIARPERRQLALALAALALLVATLQPGSWGRRPWGPDYFGVEPPDLEDPARTLVLVTGYDPVAYMIPFFPPAVRFLRIQGFVTGPSERPNANDRLMQAAVAAHAGPMFILFREYEERAAVEGLAAYRLAADRRGCRTMVPHVEPQQQHPFFFCPVAKLPGAPGG